MKKIFFYSILSFTFICQSFVFAQDSAKIGISINVSTDIVSRYIWRGQPFEQSPCFQPTLAGTYGNFTFGTWGSYSVTKDIVDENDFFLVYSQPLSIGTLAFTAYDYYNPNKGIKFFNFNSDTGAHTTELNVQFTGSDNFPFYFLFAKNVIGGLADQDKSSYFEMGYNFSSNEIKLCLCAGVSMGKSEAWYSVTESKLSVVNLGLMATKSIKISSDFSFPLSLQFTLNPYTEKSYLVLKITL